MNVKELGTVFDGGGWRYVGRQQGLKQPGGDTGPAPHHSMNGTCYLHTVIDDHSRVAYAEASYHPPSAGTFKLYVEFKHWVRPKLLATR